jgi:alpha-tubulin suppressor-like RCC1 family protein
LLAVITLVAGACSDDPTDPGRPVPAQLQLLSAATQLGTPGWPLPDSVVVEVRDAAGNPVAGVLVTWTAANRGDAIGRLADTSDAAGRVAAEWTLGLAEGEQTLSVRAGALDPVTVRATATIFHAASVTVGNEFACALTDAGQALCWGRNAEGQLGIGTVSNGTQVPTPVAGNLTFTKLSAGGHTCGLTSNGTAYCWGPNQEGEIGTGSTSEVVPAPTPVLTDVRFTTISAEGLTVSANSTCGLTASGEAWCWGDNHFGKLGNGSTESSAVPVRVQSGVAFDSIWTGYWHVCARATTGELWCWGEQESDPGAFGAGPAGLHATPVLVHPEFRFAQLALGRNFTCAITTAQSTVCWGANIFGSLGNGTESESSAVPAPVIGGHTFVSLSSSSIEETHGLTADGSVYRWGSPGNDVPGPVPVLMPHVGFTSIDSGSSDPVTLSHGSCGIGAGNAVYCVGSSGGARGVPAP